MEKIERVLKFNLVNAFFILNGPYGVNLNKNKEFHCLRLLLAGFLIRVNIVIENNS